MGPRQADIGYLLFSRFRKFPLKSNPGHLERQVTDEMLKIIGKILLGIIVCALGIHNNWLKGLTASLGVGSPL